MKILQIFNRYMDIGGEEIAVEQISRELSAHHDFQAITFDSQDWLSETSALSRLRQVLAMVWNPGSIRRVDDALKQFRPDVVILHNTMPVGSAGLLFHLVRSGVPVVQFIHNFRPFSVNGYCWGNNRLLPQGLHKNFIPEILAGSWQQSRIRTAWYGLLIWSLHQLGVYRRIDGWIAISQFMRTTFIKGGIEANRIRVIPHSWQPQCSDEQLKQGKVNSPAPLFLFLGRLTEEKGLRVLLDAWEIHEKSGQPGSLVIAGDGPLADEVKRRCESMERATWAGFQSGAAKRELLESCTALVVPSIWWEPLGLVLYEAYDFGKPVLAARSGGIVDHVRDQVTGWLHEPNDHQTLAAQMIEAAGNPDKCRRMGMQGRLLLNERNTHVWIDEFDEFVGEVIRQAGTKPNVRQATVTDRRHNADDVPLAPTVTDRRYIADDVPVAPTVTDRRYIADDVPVAPTVTDRRHIADDVPVAPTVTDRRYIADDVPVAPTVADRRSLGSPPITISVYLADQNPGHDRSFGISRMTQVVLGSLLRTGKVDIQAVVSRTSQQAPENVTCRRSLPWGTRSKTVRFLTDHLYPFFGCANDAPDLHYFPKGYLPLSHWFCHPAVVTIHDTIIQHDADHYPNWRRRFEYAYWEMMLRHTLRHADRVLTVSESSKRQIESFMQRHRLGAKEISVTYEPCQYETVPQPLNNGKDSHILHLASREPHKRTAHLVRWWHDAENQGRRMPMLHLVGMVPDEVQPLLASSRSLVRRPFLDDAALEQAYHDAQALILPSEIEGFGLPALEAYYLGTPVCYVKGTSVEEILAPATSKGGFTLDDPASLFAALDEVVAMSPEEVRQCGLKLRETYAADKVADRMLSVFSEVKI